MPQITLNAPKDSPSLTLLQCRANAAFRRIIRTAKAKPPYQVDFYDFATMCASRVTLSVAKDLADYVHGGNLSDSGYLATLHSGFISIERQTSGGAA